MSSSVKITAVVAFQDIRFVTVKENVLTVVTKMLKCVKYVFLFMLVCIDILVLTIFL